MQLSEATRGIEQRDATIITLKKNLRAARDRSASPAFGLPIMAGESSLSKKKSLQHENELTEKVEIIKALKIREKRVREINNQLRERMHADEEVASSLRQKFEDARKETLRHQGIAEEHRVRSETIEVQIRHNRKEHERLVQEHAQSKGKIQALEEELRDALNYSSKLDSKLVALKHLSRELEKENSRLRDERRPKKDDAAKVPRETEVATHQRSSTGNDCKIPAKRTPLKDYRNLEAMYERVYGNRPTKRAD